MSIVTVRVTAGESWPPMSTERTARVWAPSARAGGWKPQLTLLAGQPVQVTPALDQGPPSMLASTRTTSPSESAAVPLMGSTLWLVTVASATPAPTASVGGSVSRDTLMYLAQMPAGMVPPVTWATPRTLRSGWLLSR